VHGHQLRAAISTLLFNPRTGDIEVMHRFFSHDAEHALSLMTGEAADLLDDAEDRMRFAVYAHEHFAISGVGTNVEPLDLVGAELEGEFLWVYQRAPAPQDLNGLVVRFDTLRSVWPDQVNTLNVEREGRVQTLKFSGDDATLRVDFPRPFDD
jgi:hypothetical protein